VAGGAAACDIELAADDGAARFRLAGQERAAVYAFAGDTLHIKLGGRDIAVRETLYAPPTSAQAAGGSERELRAPMSGKVVAVLAAEGDRVERGQRLLVVEAMKMQHELAAPSAGTLARLHVKPGDQVGPRQLLAELDVGGAEKGGTGDA
jgi:geranyl-CoA carboxylase alpha subunit